MTETPAPDPTSPVPAVPVPEEERPEHDEWCESEFIHGPMAYSPCDCDNRNELRRRGFTVTKPSVCTGVYDCTAEPHILGCFASTHPAPAPVVGEGERGLTVDLRQPGESGYGEIEVYRDGIRVFSGVDRLALMAARALPAAPTTPDIADERVAELRTWLIERMTSADERAQRAATLLDERRYDEARGQSEAFMQSINALDRALAAPSTPGDGQGAGS